MYRQYLYAGDTDYLRSTAYPFMREVAKFHRAKLSRDGSGPTTWRSPTRTRPIGA
jgi:alpha-L-fucosidase 2